MTHLFDVYIIVDWSARSQPSPVKPSKDAIWIAELAEDCKLSTYYFRTRFAAKDFLIKRFLYHLEEGNRVLAGFDFSFGYPAGFAESIGLFGENKWELTWNKITETIKDNPNNSNNRFAAADELNKICGNNSEGPFWGHPVNKRFEYLQKTSPFSQNKYHLTNEKILKNKRICEGKVSGVQPGWKLMGIGSVGSQNLLGIPILNQLRQDPQIIDKIKVWPFETGFKIPTAPISFAEIWPGIIEIPEIKEKIKDEIQVAELDKYLSELDKQGRLAENFLAPKNLSEDQINQCLTEEGWTLLIE